MGEILACIAIFSGLVFPIAFWVWVFICKYILHYKGCDNKKCWYRCDKCPRLHSEEYDDRIAFLEQAQAKNPTKERADYIQFLKNQRQIYLDNPQLDRETPEQTLSRIMKEAAENEKKTGK